MVNVYYSRLRENQQSYLGKYIMIEGFENNSFSILPHVFVLI